MADHMAGDAGGQITTSIPTQRSRPRVPTVGDVMSERVVTLPPAANAAQAALLMRDEHVGSVLISGETGQLRGLVTDRDLVLRVMAAGLDAGATRIDSVCTTAVISVDTTTPTRTAMRLMREHLVRRLPVVDISGHAVGMVSVGDLAITTEPTSALADISAEPPNEPA